MSGTNPVATFVAPVNTTQNATAYKGNIDGDFSVATRVIDQFAPHQTSTPAMTITVDAGSIFSGVTLTEVAQQTSGTITAPTGSNKRIDRAVISASTGTLSIITGTPTTGTPSAPAITSGNLPVAQIGTPTNPLTTSTTTITNSIITDERNFWGLANGVVNGTVLNMQPITNSLGSNVSLNNTSTFFDGPSVAQGTSGTWFVSGTITLEDPSAAAVTSIKLWDGTTVIASAEQAITGASNYFTVSLSGYLTSPAGNLRLSAKSSSTTSLIIYNASGLAKDSTITAIRIG